MTHHPSAASLRLHGARLLFPPVATLLFLVLTEYIARGTLSGDTFVQYIFPHAEAYLLAWGLLFLVWMAVDWLTRFAPLATLLSALLGCQPAYFQFLGRQLRAAYRANTRGTILEKDGTASNELTPLQQKWSDEHWLLQYDLMFGKGYALNRMGLESIAEGAD